MKSARESTSNTTTSHRQQQQQDDDGDGPYIDLIAHAEAVADDMNATEEQQRSAHARVKRLRRRSPRLGVSVFDFDALLGTTYRLCYDATTSRADPAGDTELARQISNPFAVDVSDMQRLAYLLTRPYILLKVNTSDAVFRPEGSVAFHTKRPKRFSRKSGRDEEEPFKDGDENLILFENDTRRPMYYITIVGIDRDRRYDAASGTLAASVRPIVDVGLIGVK